MKIQKTKNTNDISKDINIENNNTNEAIDTKELNSKDTILVNNNNLNIDNTIDIDISVDNNINNIDTKDSNIKECIAKNLDKDNNVGVNDERDFKSYFNQMRVKFFNSKIWSENICKKLGNKSELMKFNINNRVLTVRLHKDTS